MTEESCAGSRDEDSKRAAPESTDANGSDQVRRTCRRPLGDSGGRNDDRDHANDMTQIVHRGDKRNRGKSSDSVDEGLRKFAQVQLCGANSRPRMGRTEQGTGGR